MYEHHSKPLIPLRVFIARLSINTLIASMITGFSLAAGMAGYRYFEGFPWIDCFLNAAMILGGMGEVTELKTDPGKIFAGCYALYAGLWVVVSIGLILAPVLHRILHHFHSHRPPNGH
jgi:hypothetical protein